MRKSMFIIVAFFLFAMLFSACGDTGSAQQAVTSPTATAQPTKPIVWSQGAIIGFHSSNYDMSGGGLSEAFTVPSTWRMQWFCMPSNDPTQSFFGVDVQHAGDISPADGETPVKTLDCSQTGHGTTVEHVGGSVTIQIVAGTGVSWDIYVQTPK